MHSHSQKQRISITVNTQLLEEVDKLTENRSAAVEAGLKLWRQQQIESQLKNFYQNRSQSDRLFEQEWTDTIQDEVISVWQESEM